MVLTGEVFASGPFPLPNCPSIYQPGWVAFWVTWTLIPGWCPPTIARTRAIPWWRSPDAMATISPPKSRSRAVTPWPNTAKPAWSNISKYSFQNLSVHCNVSEPVYVGLQMAKVILTHSVNMDNQTVEDVFIPHLMFYRLSQYRFCDIQIDIRDSLGGNPLSRWCGDSNLVFSPAADSVKNALQ